MVVPKTGMFGTVLVALGLVLLWIAFMWGETEAKTSKSP